MIGLGFVQFHFGDSKVRDFVDIIKVTIRIQRNISPKGLGLIVLLKKGFSFKSRARSGCLKEKPNVFGKDSRDFRVSLRCPHK